MSDTEQPKSEAPQPRRINGYTAILIGLAMVLATALSFALAGHPDLADKLIGVVPWAGVFGGAT